MKRFFSAFTNWKTPNIRQLLKEYKIEGEMKGNAFWKNKRSFVDAVKNAKVESITPEADKAIAYRSRTKDKGQLMGMIKGYRSYPQFRNEATVDAIYNGYKSNAPMDRPLVVDFGGGKRRVFSGNTRMDAAFHSGINPEVLVVNAHKNFSAKLKEFKMVRPAKILRSPEKFNRAAAVKAIRRHLEKLPGVDKAAVRSAFGANPLPGEITTKKQVQSYINWAKKNGENIDPNFTKSGYVDRSTLPKLATINGRPSLLAYRGIDSGGDFEQVKRKLSRPRQGWGGASARNPVSQARNHRYWGWKRQPGGIKAQPQHPNGTAMSLSTSNKVPLDFMKGDLSGEATLGVYGVDANQLIKAVRENKPTAKVGLVNSKYPAEREVTQINGGNLLAVRKYKGMKINEKASDASRNRLRRAFESKMGELKEFRSYAKTGQEERSDFLKAGLIGTGLAAAGGLAGLGLYKAGVSGAANKAAHLEKVMTRWRGMRQASAGAAAKKAASSLDASVNAQKLRATRITANIEAKKVEDRAAKAAAKTPKTAGTPVAVNPVAANPIANPSANPSAVKNRKAKPKFVKEGAANPPVAPVTSAEINDIKVEEKLAAMPVQKTGEMSNYDYEQYLIAKKAERTPPASPNTKSADSQEESNLTKTSKKLRAEIKKQRETDALKTKGANKKASKASPTPKTSTTDRVKEIKAALGRVKAKEAAAAKSPAPVAQDYSTPPETVAQKRANQKTRRDARKKRLAKNAGATTKETSAYLRNIRYFDQFQADEAGIPLTGRVAHDRFVKKIRDEDLDRRDANLLRAGLAGGAAGALFRGKLGVGKRALIGAGLGGLGVLGVRQITKNDRDIYGERNRSSKRAELIPAVGGLGAAAWLAGKRFNLLSAKLRTSFFGKKLSSRLRGIKEFGSMGVGRLYRKKAALLKRGLFIEKRDPNFPIGHKNGRLQYTEMRPALADREQYKGVYNRLANKGNVDAGKQQVPLETVASKLMYPNEIMPISNFRYDGKMQHALKHDDVMQKHETKMKGGKASAIPVNPRSQKFSSRLRGLKEFNDYRLYYFKGRNTGIAAKSADEARAKKKRGGDELVAVRTPNETERSQMSRGIWVRTRRDGKSPDQSKYGKGRGQGPARKSLSAKLRGLKEFGGLKSKVVRVIEKGLGSITAYDPFGHFARKRAKYTTQHAKYTRAQESAYAARMSQIVGSKWSPSYDGPYGAKSYTKEAKGYRKQAADRFKRDAIVSGAGLTAAGAGVGYLATRKKEQKQLAAKIRGVRFFQEKKKRELNPYVGAALSGGASGAVLGGLSIFKHGVSPLSALKSAGIAGSASAGIVGGGALIGSKLIGKPRSDESAPFSKRAAIGGALAGTGAGLLGAIVLKKTPMGRRWVNEWDSGKGLMGRPASWIKGSNLPGAMALGGLGGGLIGGAQGADEGQQVDSIRNLKKDMKKFSRKEFAIPAAMDFVKQAKAATTAWAKRHATEIGLTGAGIGSSVAASRYYGPKNKDWNKKEEKQFSHSAAVLKKAWKTDPKLKEDFLKRVSASVRNSVAANQKQVKMFGYNTQPRNKDTMAFTGPIKGWVTGENLVNSDGSKWQASSPQLINAMMREAKNKRVVVQRGGRLTGDVAAVLRGKDRERDASGRIKKREWEKSWFQNKATEAGLAVGGLAVAAAARYGHQNKDTAIGKAYWNSRKSAASTSADLKKVGGKILTSINKITGKRFSSKLARLREFDVVADMAGWEVRDPRGKSVRVFSPGSQKRERRPKEWHEKAENERKLWKAKVAAAALGGASVALIGSRIISGKSLVPKFGGGGGFKVPSHAPSAAEAEAAILKFRKQG